LRRGFTPMVWQNMKTEIPLSEISTTDPQRRQLVRSLALIAFTPSKSR
jgi:hypothetical protein